MTHLKTGILSKKNKPEGLNKPEGQGYCADYISIRITFFIFLLFLALQSL